VEEIRKDALRFLQDRFPNSAVGVYRVRNAGSINGKLSGYPFPIPPLLPPPFSSEPPIRLAVQVRKES